MNVIPAIDLRGGHCVRLHQGKFDEETRYDADPVALATKYARAGATRIHIVDLDGARDGGCAQQEIIIAIAATPGLNVQSGGGVRTTDDVARLLDGGVDRVVVGSLAVTDAARVGSWMSRFGADRFVLALDVRIDEFHVPRLATRGWQEQTRKSLWDTLEDWAGAARHVLCTDIRRDGAMQGPNTALYAECVSRHPELAFQASGGIRDLSDLQALAATGVDAAVTGKALLENALRFEEMQSYLQSA